MVSVEVDRHQQRVAVGRGLRDLLGAEHGVGAGAIFDHDRLSPILAHFLADHAGEHVGWSAGREWHDDLDRAGGKGVRALLGGCGAHRQR